jgi:hypothetical protein
VGERGHQAERAVVVVAAFGSDRALLSRFEGTDRLFSVRRWQVGIAVLLVGAAAMSGPAIAYHTFTASDEPLRDTSVDVRDYRIVYVENVENGLTSTFELDLFGATTAVRTGCRPGGLSLSRELSRSP